MFRVECIPSLRRRLCVPAFPSSSSSSSSSSPPPFPTPLVGKVICKSVHTSHACLCVAARGRRKCGLIYSRHLLWEHFLSPSLPSPPRTTFTGDKSTGGAHLPLSSPVFSSVQRPEIRTRGCSNLLTRGELSSAGRRAGGGGGSLRVSRLGTHLASGVFPPWADLFHARSCVESSSLVRRSDERRQRRRQGRLTGTRARAISGTTRINFSAPSCRSGRAGEGGGGGLRVRRCPVAHYGSKM